MLLEKGHAPGPDTIATPTEVLKEAIESDRNVSEPDGQQCGTQCLPHQCSHAPKLMCDAAVEPAGMAPVGVLEVRAAPVGVVRRRTGGKSRPGWRLVVRFV